MFGSPNGFRTVVDIVLDGTFNCSRAAARHWLSQRQPGSIVNIIATYAWTGSPGVAHSAAAKAGVWNLTMTLAAEWGPKKIRVNSVAPGVVVNGVAYLASPFASYVTGACLPIDGGYSLNAGMLGRLEELLRQLDS